MKEQGAAIVGTGQMGKQLALFLAQKEIELIIKSRSVEGASGVRKNMEKTLTKLHGIQTTKRILEKVKFTTDFGEIASYPLIFESVVEDYSIKMDVLREISSIVDGSAIIATNTSSLSIDKLSLSVNNPVRFLGVHFFNPVHKMKLVELVKGKLTSNDSIQTLKELVIELEKDPIIVQDTPGFIVNRLLLPLINESAVLVEHGVAPQDIDKAVKLGLNHPMGPLELADLIGIDTCVSILHTLDAELEKGRYTPANLLMNMIEKGETGRKVGKGFYDYSENI